MPALQILSSLYTIDISISASRHISLRDIPYESSNAHQDFKHNSHYWLL